MSRDPRIDRARELYADGNGLGYKLIAKELGVSRDKARDWVRPERRQRLKRRAERRGTCSACEEVMQGPRGHVGICARCRAERGRDLDALILGYWPVKETLREIGEAVGLSGHAVAMRAMQMRRRGVEVPARRRGRRAAA